MIYTRFKRVQNTPLLTIPIENKLTFAQIYIFFVKNMKKLKLNIAFLVWSLVFK